MNYPLNRIAYRDAKHTGPLSFKPLEDLLVIDTSALGFRHSHLLVDFMNKGGSIIMPDAVRKEVAALDANMPSIKNRDTAKRALIPLNGKALMSDAKAKGRTLIEHHDSDRETQSQINLCEALAGILPKRHAYLLTTQHHTAWYLTLGLAVDFHQENRAPQVKIEDIRNHESGAYRILDLIITPTKEMPADLVSKLGKMRGDIAAAQMKYQSIMTDLLGTPARESIEDDKPLDVRYKKSFKEDVDSILLRLLGYQLELGAPKSPSYAAAGVAQRLAPRPVNESADAHSVVLSYTSRRESNKRRIIYACDRDILQLLELRKFCDEHKEARRNVYKALHIERESQRLPKQ